MNTSNSECSSGCESGWTMYLDQSTNTEDHQFKKINSGILDEEEEEEEDEDLSMVSDASSGPRHFHEDEDCLDETTGYFYNAASASEQAKKREKKKKIRDHKGKKQSSHLLDDTASSPVVSFSKKKMELSPNEDSTTQLKGKSGFKKHFGFLKSSVSGKPASEQAGSYQGRKWE